MFTALASEFSDNKPAQQAQKLLEKCVHCGFCNATCPTYQILGNELDGPRGRLYLIKQMLEGEAPTRDIQNHLDRCLTCRNCEVTCPSGVEYVNILELGREMVDAKIQRPAPERAVRWLLKEGLTSNGFALAMKAGQALRPLTPKVLQKNIPTREQAPSKRDKRSKAHRWPAGTRVHARKVLLLLGCTQPSMRPNINSATARVLDEVGIQTLVGDNVGCCGAVRLHLGDHEQGLTDVRRTVDSWWQHIQSGEVDRIVINASGCGITVKQYGDLLAHDVEYAKRARVISDKTIDLSEWLPELLPQLQDRMQRYSAGREKPVLIYHAPCTLQHGQRITEPVQATFRALGFDVKVDEVNGHLCCGSAGTYSVLQPDLSIALRNQRVRDLTALAAQTETKAAQEHILISGNIGCISHLQSGTTWPVKHWVEVLEDFVVKNRA